MRITFPALRYYPSRPSQGHAQNSATRSIKDNSLADLDNLPDPDVLAADIVENLEAGLESFKAIIGALNNR